MREAKEFGKYVDHMIMQASSGVMDHITQCQSDEQNGWEYSCHVEQTA